MKKITVLGSAIVSVLLLNFKVNAGTFPDPHSVLGCSQAARLAGIVNFKKQPINLGLVTNILGHEKHPQIPMSRLVRTQLMDAKMGNGRPVCDVNICVKDRTGLVQEIEFPSTADQSPEVNHSQTELQTFAIESAVQLHGLRINYGSPTATVAYADPVENRFQGVQLWRVAINDREGDSPARDYTYDIEMKIGREQPILRVSAGNRGPKIPDFDVVQAITATSVARNTAMVSFASQPAAYNFYSSFASEEVIGDGHIYRINIHNATDSERPIGRASVTLDRNSNAVLFVGFKPDFDNPPARPYTPQELRIFAANAALGVHSANYPDSNKDIALTKVEPAGFEPTSGRPVYRVTIKGHVQDEKAVLQYDVELDPRLEFPVRSIWTQEFRR